MECAGRGLAFFSYQATQEIVYQEYMARSLTDKYSKLSTQMDQIIHDANAEISSLRTKLANSEADQSAMRKRCDETTNAYREKTRQHQKAQAMYDRLHAEMDMAKYAQNGADHAEHAIRSATASHSGFTRGTVSASFPQPQHSVPGHQTSMPKQRSHDSGNDLIHERGPPQRSMPYNHQTWAADTAQASPFLPQLSAGTPPAERALHVKGHPTEAPNWAGPRSSQTSSRMRQPLGALDTNMSQFQSPVAHSVRDGVRPSMFGPSGYKPARQSGLSSMMVP